ncbi:hypothetical protein [Natronoarchaeum mannanilyticum]
MSSNSNGDGKSAAFGAGSDCRRARPAERLPAAAIRRAPAALADRQR